MATVETQDPIPKALANQLAPDEQTLPEWVNDALENHGHMLLAGEGIAVDRRQKNSAIAYALTEFAATHDQKKLAERLATIIDAEGSDMGVSVGNTINNYHYQGGSGQVPEAPTAPAAPEPVVPSAPSPPTEQLSQKATLPHFVTKATLPQWVKTAALVVGSALTGGAGTAVINAIVNRDTTTIVAPAKPNPYDIKGAVTPLSKD